MYPVDVNGDCLGACRLDLAGDREVPVVSPRCYGHVCAGLSQCVGECFAQSHVAAGHNSDLAREVERLQYTH